MIKINCRHCNATYLLKEEDLQKFRGQEKAIVCKNCQKQIRIKIKG